MILFLSSKFQQSKCKCTELHQFMLHGILYEKKSLVLGNLFKALLKAFVVNCLIVS